MTIKTSKSLLFVVIGMLAVVSIWFLINRYLQRIRASTDDVIVRFDENSKTVNTNEEFNIEVWLEHADKRYSGATIGIKYNKNALQLIGSDNSICNELETEIKLDDLSINSDTNSITWTKISSKNSSSLPKGLVCFGSLKFIASATGNIEIADPVSFPGFEIVGPDGTYNPVRHANYFQINITISTIPTNAPSLTPTSGPGTSPTPSLSPTPALTNPSNCLLKSQGDADCDGDIDSSDYNIWKCEFIGGGICSDPSSSFSADFDLQAGPNIIDFEIWRENSLK